MVVMVNIKKPIKPTKDSNLKTNPQLSKPTKAKPKSRSIYLYLKYLLSLTLFLSLAFSLYLSTSTTTSTTTTHLLPLSKPLSLPSLALSVDSSISIPNPHRTPNLKLYVYDLPSTYNEDWLTANQRCSHHLFAAEVAIHRALLRSGFRTLDPDSADFFFVPVYVSCNFNTSTGFPSLSHARPMLESAVRKLAGEMPYWNRSAGADHVFVASHDYGACFHAVEELAIADGIPEFMKNSIVLQTFGVKSRHVCQEVEHILIPPYVSPERVRLAAAKTRKTVKRDIWAFFRGKMELHPKNSTGHFYGRGVRTTLWKKFSHKRRFYLRRSRYDGYLLEMARSVFCLCPLGWAPWSPRLVESVVMGCVPVIIADGIRLPFPSIVPWSTISLTVAEKDIGRLTRILDRVAATNLSTIQRNLQDPAIRQALLYHETVQFGDATWQILETLSCKLKHPSKKLNGQIELDTWK